MKFLHLTLSVYPLALTMLTDPLLALLAALLIAGVFLAIEWAGLQIKRRQEYREILVERRRAREHRIAVACYAVFFLVAAAHAYTQARRR